MIRNCSRRVLLMINILLLALAQQLNGQYLKKLKQQAEEKIIIKAGDILDDKKVSGNATNTQPETQAWPEPQKNEQEVPRKHSDIAFHDPQFLVYTSPDPAFHDIVIQKFKGLPRFGYIDFYMMRDNPKKVDLSKEAGDKRRLTGLGYSGFAHLTCIHILKDHFKVMDKTALTQRTKGVIIEEEAKSTLAQKVLMEFAFEMGTDALKKEYFMNDWSGDGKSPFVRKWGGHQSDDFTENEKYVSFVQKYLEIILKWSENFFSEGTEDFQLVHEIKFQGQYDFDKGGFWLRLPIRKSPNGIYSVEYFTEFSPTTSYGHQLFNKTKQVDYINGEVLFKISPEKAEALMNDKSTFLQMTTKVRSVFKGLDPGNPFVYGAYYTYHFLDPVMEIYGDVQLTKKIGVINLENLIYKEPD